MIDGYRGWLGLLAALLLMGCGPEPPELPSRPDIFLIVIDTLRADHLGTYGYERDTSPNLDRFAQESVVFTQNRSQASCTFPSANSLLTSRSPEEFLGRPKLNMSIPEDVPSLPTLLQDQGYWTLAVSASPIVRNEPSRFNPHGGFGNGFDLFDEGCVWQKAECVFNRFTVNSNERTDSKPLFAYLHFMDPHGPYRPPDYFQRVFAKEWNGNPEIGRGNPNPISDGLRGLGPVVEYSKQEIEHLKDLYDDEIRYLDQTLERLFEVLRRKKFYRDAIVAIVADHGESFLEHPGAMKHCYSVWDTEVHTPLIFRIPGIQPRRLESSTRNLDVLPTLMDYAGLSLPEGLDGLSLRPLIESRKNPVRLATSIADQYHAVSDGRFKLVHNFTEGRLKLYDLADGREVEVEPTDHRRVFRRLRKSLLEETRNPHGAQEAIKNLEALGYL